MDLATPNISFFVAFSAGFLSFVSPCVLPLVPSYLSYITGLSLEELTVSNRRARMATMKHSLMFIVGFSTIFIAFGVSATALGRFFLTHQAALRQIGGAIMIFFGLTVAGVIQPAFLMRDTRLHLKEKPAGLIGSFLVGIAFGAGWTPCVGPILGTILLYASSVESMGSGIGLLAAYAIGLGLPLFVASLSVPTFLARFRQSARFLPILSRVTGLLLVVIGVMLMTRFLPRLTALFFDLGIGWTIGQ